MCVLVLLDMLSISAKNVARSCWFMLPLVSMMTFTVAAAWWLVPLMPNWSFRLLRRLWV